MTFGGRRQEPVLLAPNLDVLDLSAATALAASIGPTLGIGHTICEAQRPSGIIVTGRAVNVYDHLDLAVLKL